MKKQVSPKIVSLIFAVLVVCFVIAFYVVADWTEPTEVPPGGNVPAPLNVSNIGQTKIGGLALNTGPDAIISSDGADNGLLVYEGNVGIGTTGPQAKLDVNGGIRLGSDTACNSNKAGTMRYYNNEIEYCNGTNWIGMISIIPIGNSITRLFLAGHGGNYITNNWYDDYTDNGIDGDVNTYVGGGRQADGRPVYMTYLINLIAARTINSITIDYICMSHDSITNRKVELWNGSNWITISNNDAKLPMTDYTDKPGSLIGLDEKATITGNWDNISKIRIYLYSTASAHSTATAIFNVDAQ